MTPHQGRYAAYYRVSTGGQGASGRGLDAQKQKVQDFLDGGRWQLTTSFTEIESGRRGDRPELAKALAYCKRHKTTPAAGLTKARLPSARAAALTRLRCHMDIERRDRRSCNPLGRARAGDVWRSGGRLPVSQH